MITTRTRPDGSDARWRNALANAGRGLVLFAFAITEIVVTLLVTAAAGLTLLVVGMFLLPPAVRLLRRTADRARRWAGTWSGVTIDSPYQPPAPGRPGPHGLLTRCRDLLRDPATWRDYLWVALDPFSGALVAALPAGLMVWGLFGVGVQPFVWRRIELAGGSNWYTAIQVHSIGTALAGIPVGLALIWAGLAVAPIALRWHASWTRLLLGSGSPAAGASARPCPIAGK